MFASVVLFIGSGSFAAALDLFLRVLLAVVEAHCPVRCCVPGNHLRFAER